MSACTAAPPWVCGGVAALGGSVTRRVMRDLPEILGGCWWERSVAVSRGRLGMFSRVGEEMGKGRKGGLVQTRRRSKCRLA